MGKVFTFEEIQAGRIPLLENFEAVQAIISQALEASPDVTAAAVLGSCLYGNHTVRSDIDVLVLYPLHLRAAAVALMKDLHGRAGRLYVPVQFISLDNSLAVSNVHHIASTFLGHFRLAARAGGVIKGNPLHFISRRRSLVADTKGYLSHKLRTFENYEKTSHSFSEEQMVSALGKALSFPVYAARMMLQCRKKGDLADGDAKTEVVARYPRTQGAETSEVFLELLKLDRLYSQVLGEQIAHPGADQYRRLINFLAPAIPLAWEFARLNLDSLCEASAH